jgi:hypothetical protein
VTNWKNELNKFVPGYFRVIAITDPKKAVVDKGIRDYFDPSVR